VAKRGIAKGYQWSELSWTHEDDALINVGTKAIGGRVYGRYRVYRKTLRGRRALVCQQWGMHSVV
jgi:hypothetical protein